MSAHQISAIILAAGHGTRMKSTQPKVLHRLAGRPMIHHVVQAAMDAGAHEVIVVVGHGRDEVSGYLAGAFGDRVRTAVQEEQRGTGHAVMCGLPAVSPGADSTLVLCGDTPLIEPSSLQRMIQAWGATPGSRMAMLTCTVHDPHGYGRVLRDDDNRVTGVREHKDCNGAQLEIREINPGIYIFQTGFLREALPRLTARNAQGELYLTDTVELAASTGVYAIHADAETLRGVNDRAQLHELEQRLLRRVADRWRAAGATIREGAVIEDTVVLAPDVVIEHGAVLRGNTRVERGARIDVGCVLDDARVAEDAYLKPYSVVTSSSVGKRAQVGPFSHLRPGSELHEESHIGNFVETKNTVVRQGAKANHLAYLGDGDIGEGANIGAGTIFCNYDGFQKHKTTIGAGAFVGSDSQLVAPVTVGEGAYVGTGTTVTKDVPPHALAIGRAAQQNKEGYGARLRTRLQAAARAAKEEK
jgi:bifunctional UDP-N-acetylglucosamine pyrophosphorylase / glucosamine-1-phosphate N-acetyltransferase